MIHWRSLHKVLGWLKITNYVKYFYRLIISNLYCILGCTKKKHFTTDNKCDESLPSTGYFNSSVTSSYKVFRNATSVRSIATPFTQIDKFTTTWSNSVQIRCCTVTISFVIMYKKHLFNFHSCSSPNSSPNEIRADYIQ